MPTHDPIVTPKGVSDPGYYPRVGAFVLYRHYDGREWPALVLERTHGNNDDLHCAVNLHVSTTGGNWVEYAVPYHESPECIRTWGWRDP